MPEDLNNIGNYTEETRNILSVAGETTITVGTVLEPEDSETLWGIVQKGFVDLNRRSYEKQDMTREEFMADIDSPDVLKFTARDDQDNLTGCMTVHMGLSDVPWVDNSWCSDEQARVDATAPSYYIGTLVVPVNLRGTQTSRRLLQGALLYFRERNEQTQQNSLCFFDCADANDPWLAEFARKCAAPTDNFSGESIDIYKLGEEWWVRQPDGEVIKMVGNEHLDNSSDLNILDKQHFYAIRLKGE